MPPRDDESRAPVEPHPSRRLLLGAGGLLAAAGAARAQGGGALPESVSGLPTGVTGRPMPRLERQPAESDRRVGYAVVGLGKYAINQILPNFARSRSSRLVSVVSGNPEKARAIAGQYGVEPAKIYGYDDFGRIAADEAIEAVYVILPNALHAEYAIRASRAGKHVLCEKPMAVSVAQCEAMIRAAEEARRRLMVAYRCHFEPYNLEAVRLIREGELGTVRVVTTDNGRPIDLDDPADQWRVRRDLAGGGSLLDVGIYGVNAARYLTNEEPVEIKASIHNPPDDPRFREVEDVVTWQLRFPSGALAHGSTSYSYAGTSRFGVQGTKASLLLDPATSYYQHEMTVKALTQVRRFAMPEGNQFAAQLDHLSEAILGDTAIGPDGAEGMQDVRLILAMYEAARTGQTVRVDWTHRRAG